MIMPQRIQNFILAALFALLSFFWAQMVVFEKGASGGGHQLFGQAESGSLADNSLIALEKITYPAKTAPDYVNAPKKGVRAPEFDSCKLKMAIFGSIS